MKNLTIKQLISVAILTITSTASLASPLAIQLPTLSIPTISMPELITDMTVDNVSFESFWETATEQLIAESSQDHEIDE